MGRPYSGYKIDGKRVPGVTTIIGRFKDSGALLWWAYGQGQAAERGEINGLYDKRDEAAAIGTVAHEMTEEYLAGREPEKPLEALDNPEHRAQAIQAYKMFLEWWEMSNLKAYRCEIPLVSEAHKFGGTPDWILETPRGLAIGDIKTSSGIYADYLIQVAAYQILWEENYPDEPITGGFHICRFSKEFPDFDHKYYADLPEAREQFLLFRDAYENDEILKRRAK